MRRHWKQINGQWWLFEKSLQYGVHKTKGILKPCAACGQEFPAVPSNKRAKFCGRACQGLWQSRKNFEPSQRIGEQSPLWKGGKTLDASGYIRIHVADHWSVKARGEKLKTGNATRYVLEHRVVMERMLGRALLSNENVHHINGVKTDNRPENLELWIKAQPPGIRQSDYHCACCIHKNQVA